MKLSLTDLEVYLENGKIDAGEFRLLCEDRMSDIMNLTPGDAKILNRLGYLTDIDYDMVLGKNLPLVQPMVMEVAEKNKLNYEGKTDINML